MTDIPINVDITLGVNQASLKQVARQVGQEIGNVLTELAVGIDTSKVKKELDKIPRDIQINVDFITFENSAIKAANKYLNETLGVIKISDISLAKTKVANARKQIKDALNNIKIDNISLDVRIKDDIKKKLSSIDTLRISHVSLDTRIKDDIKQKLSSINTIRISNVSLDTRIKDDLKQKLGAVDTLRISKVDVAKDAITKLIQTVSFGLSHKFNLHNVYIPQNTLRVMRREVEENLRGISVKVNASVQTFTEDVALPTLNSANAFVAATETVSRSLGGLSSGAKKAEQHTISLANAFSRLEKIATTRAEAPVDVSSSNFLPGAIGAISQATPVAAVMAAAVGGAAGGGGIPPIIPPIIPPTPPPPPPPPSSQPPSDDDPATSARIDKLEAEIARVTEALKVTIEALTARMQQANAAAQSIATNMDQKVAKGTAVLAEVLNKTNSNLNRVAAASGSAVDIFVNLDRYKSVLERTIENLKKQGASQGLIANLTKKMEQIEALRLAFANKSLKDMQKKQALDEALAKRDLARENVGIGAQVAKEEKEILNRLEERRKRLRASLEQGGKIGSGAARIRSGDDLREAERKRIGEVTKKQDEVAEKIVANNKARDALLRAQKTAIARYGEDSEQAQVTRRALAGVAARAKELQDAQAALTRQMISAVSIAQRSPIVPRVGTKVNPKTGRSETDIALFGENGSFSTDGSGNQVGGARLLTEQVIVKHNQQIIANKLKEVRASNDYISSTRELINAQRTAAKHQYDMGRKTEQLERSVQRTFVSTQATLASLASQKPFAGNAAQKQFDSNIAALGPGGQDVQTQARFLELMQQQGVATGKTSKALKSHNGIIGKTSELISNLNVHYTAGQKAAFEFGKAAISAAQRFAAWAVPAAIMFRTLSVLQEATQEIIKLDTQATRLAFFSPSFFQGTADSVDRFNLTVRKVNESLTSIIETAKQTGLSISQTSEAFIEIARAGIAQSSGLAGEKAFRDAVTSLVQVEAGALSSADAVVKLNAILNQFNLNPLQDAKLVAAQLFQESQRSAFSVGELADAVSRVGSAFAGIQNLRFDQVLGLIGQGATQTGASVSRLATALRQLATLAAQNAEELSNFGVSVSTSEGQLTGFEDVLNVLEKINSLSGTVFQRQLASLVADRRNIADIIALSRNVELLRKAVKEGASEQVIAADASAAIQQLQLAQAAAAETLTQKIERLKTSIVELVEQTGLRGFLSDFFDFTRRIATGAQSLIPIVSALASVLKSVVIFKGAQLFGSALRGAVTERLSSRINSSAIDATSNSIKEGRIQDAITHSLDAQLITKKKAAELEQLNVKNLARRANFEIEFEKAESDILTTRNLASQGFISEAEAGKRLEQLTNRRNAAERGIIDSKIQQEKIQRNLNSAIADGIVKQQGFLGVVNKLKPALLSAGAVAGIFAVDAITRSFTKVNEEAAKALRPIDVGREVGSGILNGIVTGAITGGSFGGVPGAIAGAAAGGIAGGVINFFDAKSKNKEISQELDRQRKLQQDSSSAAERQIELVRLQSSVNLRTSSDQDAALNRQLALQTRIQEVQIKINAVGEERATQLGLLSDLQETQKDLILVQEQIAIRESERTKERVALEEDLIKIRERGSRIITAIGLIEDARISALERTKDEAGVAEIKIKFNREQIAREIKTAQNEASRLAIAIARLEREPGRDQEEKRLAADRQRAEETIVNLRLKLIAEELRGQKEIFRIAEENAKKTLENYQNVAGQVAQSLTSVVQEQNKIADIIGRQGETSLEALRVESERQFALISAQGLDENALARQLARAQSQIAQQAFAQIEATAQRQLDALGNTPLGFIGDINEEVARLSALFADVNKGLGLFGREVTDEQREKARQANEEIGVFKQRIDQERAAIAVRKQAVQREIQVINSLITAKQREGEAIQERINKEAEIGKEFLQTPEKIVGELRNLLLARSALSRIRGDNQEGFINSLEDRIRRTQSQGVPGSALLQNILEGLQAAEKFNVRLSNTLSPQQLTTTFSRLIAFQAGRVNGSLNEQRTVQDEISSLRLAIVEKLNAQIDFDTKEANLNDAARQLAASQAQTLADLQGRLADELKKATEKRESERGVLEGIERKIENFGTSIPTLSSEINSLQYTTGDIAIIDAINKSTQAINFLVQSSPEARQLKEQAVKERTPQGIIGTFLNEAIGLNGGNASKFFEEFTKNQLLTNGTLNELGKQFTSSLGITAQEIASEAQKNGIKETEALIRLISNEFNTSDERAESIGKLNSDTQKTLLSLLISQTNDMRQIQNRNLEVLQKALKDGNFFAGGGNLKSNIANALSPETRNRLVASSANAKTAISELTGDVLLAFYQAKDKIPQTILDSSQINELAGSEKLFEARQIVADLEKKNAAEAEALRKTLAKTNPELLGIVNMFEILQKTVPDFAIKLAAANGAIIELSNKIRQDVSASISREVDSTRRSLEARAFTAQAVTPTERAFSDALSGQDKNLQNVLFDFIDAVSRTSREFDGRLSEQTIIEDLIGASASTNSAELLQFLKTNLTNPRESQALRELLQSTSLLQNSPLFSGGGQALADLIFRARDGKTGSPVDVSRFDPATRAVINDFFSGRQTVTPPQEEPADVRRRKEAEAKVSESSNNELIESIKAENEVRRQNVEAVKQSKEAFDKAANQFKNVAEKLDKRDLIVQAQPVQIAAESVENLNTSINESITSSISSLAETISRLEAVVTNSQINVEFGDFNVRLFAEIIAKIQDNGFADALRERLAGTAIESQVDAIINAVTDVIRAMESTTPPLLSSRTEAIDAVISNSSLANGGKTKPGRKR